jgi:hypothetical protein
MHDYDRFREMGIWSSSRCKSTTVITGSAPGACWMLFGIPCVMISSRSAVRE